MCVCVCVCVCVCAVLSTHKRSILLHSDDTEAQGSEGNIKAAFWIWSMISSSSLNGNVPLRL